MISLKSDSEIRLMQKAGEILGKVFERLQDEITAGVKTSKLDKIAAESIKGLGGNPAFFGYKGFPGNICTSKNDVVVHGIPSDEKLQKGDIISIDIGVEYGGYNADAAATFGIGKITPEAERLITVTERSLYLGIENARARGRLADVSCAIQGFVESNGFSVVRAYVGHGIGSTMHEEPEVPNFGIPNTGLRLEAGMALAIEPMVNQGTFKIKVLEDGWTAKTLDGSLSAHFEHTVIVTKGDPLIITKWQKKNQ